MANDTSKYEIYLGFDVQILKTILKIIYQGGIQGETRHCGREEVQEELNVLHYIEVL